MSEVPVREEISALFAAAIELPAAGRTAFVRDADVSESVRREVASLLAVYEQAQSQAEGLEPELAAQILDGEHGGEADVRPDRSDLEGRLIGPYRLLRELGHGGMGVVYLAERADGA